MSMDASLPQITNIYEKLFEENVITKEQKEIEIATLTGEKKTHIMACGLTGVGKSTILNGLVGENLFKVGDTLNEETAEVEKKSHFVPGLNAKVIAYDTPGFSKAFKDKDEYTKKIKGHCKDVDVLLYCISVESPRAVMDKDIEVLKLLKSALDDDIWKHCVIVLTFANTIISMLQEQGIKDVKKNFRIKLSDWKKKVVKAFEEAAIKDAISIVPAGISCKPSFLNDERSWSSELWFTVFDKLSNDGKIGLLMINAKRIKESGNPDPKLDAAKQDIIIPHETWFQKHKRKVLGGGAGASTAAGITGASTGAIIGALAIGIPSFGTAAGVGLVLGALVGGGIAVGTSVGTTLAITAIKERQHQKKEERKSEKGKKPE